MSELEGMGFEIGDGHSMKSVISVFSFSKFAKFRSLTCQDFSLSLHIFARIGVGGQGALARQLLRVWQNGLCLSMQSAQVHSSGQPLPLDKPHTGIVHNYLTQALEKFHHSHHYNQLCRYYGSYYCFAHGKDSS